jgi:hypothetical protein
MPACPVLRARERRGLSLAPATGIMAGFRSIRRLHKMSHARNRERVVICGWRVQSE